MKAETITVRLSKRRVNKLRLLAAQQDKTMTQIIEDCLDKLPEPEATAVGVIDNSSPSNIA